MNAPARAPDVNAVLAADRQAADHALERAAAAITVRLPAVLAAPAGYALDARGKRLRPILCVAAYRAAAGRPPAGGTPAVPGAERGRRAVTPSPSQPRSAGGKRFQADDAIHDVAAAIEVIHTYSLMHDDLPCMDDDDVRRGRPTPHRVFDVASTALAGAALIPHALAWLDAAGGRLGLDAGGRAAIVTELARGAGADGMVGGQLLDLDAEARPIELGELEDIHRRKTGALFETAVRIGGIAARAERDTISALGDYGRALGLAFQITDDLLDETAESSVLGKTAGRDREREKSTFPALLGPSEARRRAVAAGGAALAALERGGIDDEPLRALVSLALEREC